MLMQGCCNFADPCNQTPQLSLLACYQNWVERSLLQRLLSLWKKMEIVEAGSVKMG